VQRMLIALDVDGTLFDGTSVAVEAVDALHRAKADGHVLVIVSGRQWDSLGSVVPTVLHLFDRVVCEEGGVLVDVAAELVTLLAAPVEPGLVEALRRAGVPALDVGLVVVGAPTEFAATMAAERDRAGSDRVLVTNKGSVALVPPECDKSTGLRAAIADLGAAGLPIIAIGDAENDLPMFALADIAVGVANADAAVRAAGVELTHGVAGAGVAEALRRHLPATA
jgi:hydroxymethylpyrimidine pyrophosphatase-like HAD family hydrolase